MVLLGKKKGILELEVILTYTLTQGPYFTKVFLENKKIHKDFEVVETGWSRIDNLFKTKPDLVKRKQESINKI